MILTDEQVRILEVAERLERIETDRGAKEGLIITELNLSATRFTQILMHLVVQPEVVRDPRWTMLARRIRETMESATQRRALRTFAKVG